MFRDRERHASTPARRLALDCLAAGVRAADPERATRAALARDGDRLLVGPAGHGTVEPDAAADTGGTTGAEATTHPGTTEHPGATSYDLAAVDRVVVLGGGKAATGVARAAVEVLGSHVDDGLLVVPADDPAVGGRIGPVEVAAGGHPTPTASGAEAAARVRSLAADADGRTLVVAVLTGGGSALLAAPAGDLDLGDLQSVTRELLDAGTDVAELNAVRKHCSALKGGRLAATAAPAQVCSLLVSDVVGDDPTVVASGPTAPDPTTYADALAVLDRYDIAAPAVRDHLRAGDRGERRERPAGDDEAFVRTGVHVVAGSDAALDGAARAAREAGATAHVVSDRVRGPAREAARVHVALAAAVETCSPSEPVVLLSGGETTVRVDGDGVGGPNLEFCLAAALALREQVSGAHDDATPVALGAIDTDGRDGSTHAAGALVDASTVRSRGPDAADPVERARGALADNDALTALDEYDAVLHTGATGTNVNDLRVVVVGDAGRLDADDA